MEGSGTVQIIKDPDLGGQKTYGFQACSGSVLLTSWSGSCSFRQWPSWCQLKIIFFWYYLLKIHLHHSSQIRNHKEVTKRSQNSRKRNQGFSSFFLLMMEGSGPVLHTNGSGWAIRIRNTVPRTRNTGCGSKLHRFKTKKGRIASKVTFVNFSAHHFKSHLIFVIQTNK